MDVVLAFVIGTCFTSKLVPGIIPVFVVDIAGQQDEICVYIRRPFMLSVVGRQVKTMINNA